MSVAYKNSSNLCCLYDDIGNNVSEIDSYTSAAYSIVSSFTSTWPNCVYNIHSLPNEKPDSEDLFTRIADLSVKPVVISVDDPKLDSLLKQKGYLPIERWEGMYRSISAQEIFTCFDPGLLHTIKEEAAIEEWLNIVSEELFRGKIMAPEIFVYLFRKGHKLIYIRLDGTIIGTALIYTDINGIVGVYMVCIKKECRGKGYGKKLMQYCLSQIKEMNKEICVLQSTNDGLSLYNSLGFLKSNTYTLFWKIR